MWPKSFAVRVRIDFTFVNCEICHYSAISELSSPFKIPVLRRGFLSFYSKAVSWNPPIMSFAFAFSGDDIDDDASTQAVKEEPKPVAGAFPVQGKPQLPPTQHDLVQMLGQLPSKIAYGFLDVRLEDGSALSLPRRELWDVRVQLMAEDDGSGSEIEGLGSHDVKTGVYEGGFKSWESSLDLVQVLGWEPFAIRNRACRVVEVSSTEEVQMPCRCKD